MTKYKLNNDVRTSSEVTLTSYLAGGREERLRPGAAVGPPDGQDKNSNGSAADRNRCRACHQPLAAPPPPAPLGNFTRHDCRLVSEHNVECGLDRAVCLCEKYNGGCCRLCPRPPPPPPPPACSCAGGGVDDKLQAVGAGGMSCGACSGTLCHGSYSKSGEFPACGGGGGGGGGGVAGKLPPAEVRGGAHASLARRLAARARSACSTKTLLKRLPILAWLPHYNLRAGLSDMIAGLTVGLTVIPQAIAYANVAGLPPQYGLYSSFMACFVYTVFGSCKDSPIGPTAIAAILTRENLHGLGPEFAVLLCFLSGCVELLMGVLQLGFLIDFISGPVSVGFTSAAAIIIATTQVKDVLGLSFPGGKFLQVWSGLYEHVGETRLWDTVLGLSCILLLLVLRKVKDINVGNGKELSQDGRPNLLRNSLANVLWFLSTTRNILVVVVCAALAYYFDTRHQTPFVLTGEVKPGLPALALPPFQSTVGNHTYTFVEMGSTLGSAIFVVPLLSILENIALAKVFSEGKYVDATQEMIAIGLCNMASSLVDSMPVSGALSRGAVNHASGVQTTFGGVYTGILVLLSLQYFTPYFYYIPKASLAAVIIAAVVFMMELHVFKPIWRTKKLDLIPAVVTFVSCLLIRLELGIVIGIATNLLFLLYASARPSVRVTWATSASGVEHLVGAVDRSLSFPSAEYVRRALRKAADTRAASALLPPLVIDATHVQAADFTAAKGIKSLIDDFHARGQPLIFYNVKPSIAEIFRGVRPREFLHCACPAQLDAMLRAAAAKQRATVANVAASGTHPV